MQRERREKLFSSHQQFLHHPFFMRFSLTILPYTYLRQGVEQCMDRILLSENDEGHKLVSNGAVMDRAGEKGERFPLMD